MKGQVFGEISCPHCTGSMTVKADKNGEPFGYCDSCKGQLRVGGNAGRVSAFVKKYPHIGAAMGMDTVTEKEKIARPPAAINKPVTDTGKKDDFTLFEGN